METLSFILGIAFIVVIALSVVATYAFVKVLKTRKEIDNLVRDLDMRFGDVYQRIHDNSASIHRRIDDFEKDIYSQLDSRLDKLENKLINKK
jgi:hypothetical protein